MKQVTQTGCIPSNVGFSGFNTNVVTPREVKPKQSKLRWKLSALFNEVKPIAENNPYGFTLNKNLKPIKKGFIVASALTQNSFGDDGLKRVLAIVFKQPHERFDGVGGWLNEEDGQYYFDAVKVFTDRKEAVKYGKEQKQIAIYDLNKGKEIKLKY